MKIVSLRLTCCTAHTREKVTKNRLTGCLQNFTFSENLAIFSSKKKKKNLDHKFTAIDLSETHLKGKPLDFYQLPGYNFEYVNRVVREKS